MFLWCAKAFAIFICPLEWVVYCFGWYLNKNQDFRWSFIPNDVRYTNAPGPYTCTGTSASTVSRLSIHLKEFYLRNNCSPLLITFKNWHARRLQSILFVQMPLGRFFVSGTISFGRLWFAKCCIIQGTNPYWATWL